jgi:Icc-related predicted phosphoesterase
MKIKVFSDCHGYLPKINDSFDLMLIAGDITPAEWGFGSKSVQWEWIINEFKNWLDALPYNDEYSKVYLVPGNHDKVFENLSHSERLELEVILGNRFELLIHEKKIFSSIDKNITIFGTPYCKIFGNWSFMMSDSFLDKAFSEIPENIDILVTHDPPQLNKLGTITQGRQTGKEAGNEILAKHVLKVKPKYVFSGHIHSGNHKLEDFNGIKMANVAYVDEYYNPVNDVLTFEL